MLQVLLNGLVNGAIYSLVAVSVTLIFSILRIPHFGLGGIKPDATLQMDLAWRDATGRVVKKTVPIHPG